MRDVLLAFGRSLRSLTRRGVLWHLVWPALLALALWSVLAIVYWDQLIGYATGWISGWAWLGSLFGNSGAGEAVLVTLLSIVFFLLLIPLVYATAAVLVATIALPLMLERVAAHDYADLEQRRGGSNLGSVWNALSGGLVFLAGFLLSLPFWLIPGVGLVVSVLLTAWLNRKAFGYDALMMHADHIEMRRLPARHRGALFGLGIGCALLAYIPLLNLLAPAFCGLAFVHYLLEALRRERTDAPLASAAPPGAPRIGQG